MARSNDWEKMAMAQGDPRPTWPLPTVVPKFATWSLGGGRPFACTQEKCERWHAGIDLTNAPDGALIIAPEDAIVVAIDRGWSEGSKAAFLRTWTASRAQQTYFNIIGEAAVKKGLSDLSAQAFGWRDACAAESPV